MESRQHNTATTRSSLTFIAHRGAAAAYPENTILAVERALAGGVNHVEIDVQLSADRVPMLSHDDSLLRTGGVDRLVSATLASELRTIGVGERNRFGSRFDDVRVDTLRALIERLEDFDDVRLFVELKRDALRAFGRNGVLAAVLPVLARSRHQPVLISFDAPVLALARRAADYPVGWVLPTYNTASEERARALLPEFLFCNRTRLPRGGPLWSGCWEWAVYEITDIADARQLGLRGVGYIESMHAVDLMQASLAT